MKAGMEPLDVQMMGMQIFSLLGLSASPVGVRLCAPEDTGGSPAERLTHHRYCQAVMLARHDKAVTLDAEGIACPAAASVFGFKPLPESLQTGKGLVGFGIVSDPQVGAKMFAGMPRLEPGKVTWLHLMPLESCTFVPDVVVVEDEVEKLMWIVLSYMHATGGGRVPASTAVLQAACVDSTLIPYLEDRLNFSFSCYGCRDATDIKTGEALVGFSGRWLPAIVDHLVHLAQKAMPASRSKRAYQSLQRDSTAAGKI